MTKTDEADLLAESRAAVEAWQQLSHSPIPSELEARTFAEPVDASRDCRVSA